MSHFISNNWQYFTLQLQFYIPVCILLWIHS